ncbi:uncharacterized protein H6S33_003602 [Morchella sextelata]|uniref:uncharacterized protein n=1 Tax=Morchella sextelata TaxID=1174677 RepID=UPI001D036BE2|nr:uncharacterized protein H6S33_003602 [Morchella sextelata]KAH0606768.1 hypothetical protein H6S33_003602 [Morchella sextelata]
MAQPTPKVALVIGASRGIGRQVAIDLSKAGYTVVVSAKSTSDDDGTKPFPPDPNSRDSTITTVAREITELHGGKALAIPVDVQHIESIEALVSTTLSKLGRIDTVIYNSGAIWWGPISTTPLKRFQLLQRINPEGLYKLIQTLLPVFESQGWRARVIVVSPPIYSRFFRGKTAYAIGKVGMSVLTKGLAMEWEAQGRTEMAITSIWPAAAIRSGATEGVELRDLRSPTIFSDAMLAMLEAPTKVVNGLLDTDEDFLRRHKGVTDFSGYALVPGSTPRRIMPAEFPDLTVKEQDDEGDKRDSVKLRAKL